jgi:hypothetical protein
MWLFAIYITIETFVQFSKMDKGDKVCRLFKYISYMLVALIGAGIGFVYKVEDIMWVWLAPNAAIALTLWPTTYARATGQFKNRIGDI